MDLLARALVYHSPGNTTRSDTCSKLAKLVYTRRELPEGAPTRCQPLRWKPQPPCSWGPKWPGEGALYLAKPASNTLSDTSFSSRSRQPLFVVNELPENFCNFVRVTRHSPHTPLSCRDIPPVVSDSPPRSRQSRHDVHDTMSRTESPWPLLPRLTDFTCAPSCQPLLLHYYPLVSLLYERHCWAVRKLLFYHPLPPLVR